MVTQARCTALPSRANYTCSLVTGASEAESHSLGGWVVGGSAVTPCLHPLDAPRAPSPRPLGDKPLVELTEPLSISKLQRIYLLFFFHFFFILLNAKRSLRAVVERAFDARIVRVNTLWDFAKNVRPWRFLLPVGNTSVVEIVHTCAVG